MGLGEQLEIEKYFGIEPQRLDGVYEGMSNPINGLTAEQIDAMTDSDLVRVFGQSVNLIAVNYPSVCPWCETVTTVKENMPFCPHFNCKGRVYGRVLKYVEALDLKGVGEETIRGLVEKGVVKHPRDLYTVDLIAFCNLERKGAKGFEKLKQGLAAKATMDFYAFVGALSLDEVAENTALNLAKAGFDTIEKIVDATPDQLATAERMTVRKAEAFKASLMVQIAEVRDMIAKGYVKFRTAEKKTSITGKTVVITGTLSKPRNFYKDALAAAGAFLGSSVTAKTHFLVAADPSENSTKLKDARAKGVKVVGEAELMQMLEA